ncbi:hypothetical protein C479_04417 [Halovivax asiaticus JCM 14624]|uniref:Uncharacterized protein n=1 Tax=Halovivax asiaticus JCM 14624 TaxID=1227490 RepID=M0BP34_9EURY|nr:TMEM165/GDT1 family protein [Halovivax asiaticus]ELZ12610.1 hypothetical protein C479_04417 [Halovivax asiaticus JCM 14624]
MSGFVDIVWIAFVAQLLALPGEKGQLVIASLATKYNPYMVVAGAATAFGGWTAIEILLGSALEGALPAGYLDAITAGLFVVFAVWILYASNGNETSDAQADGADAASDFATTDGGVQAGANPHTDGGHAGSRLESVVPKGYRGFGPAFSLMVVGEFGDKTQLVTIGLAAQYGVTSAIWIGEMLAIVPVSLATALLIDRSAHRVDRTWLHRIAAGIFLLFALDIVASYTIGVSFLPL